MKQDYIPLVLKLQKETQHSNPDLSDSKMEVLEKMVGEMKV